MYDAAHMNTSWVLIGFLALNLALSVTADAIAKVWAVTDRVVWMYAGLGVSVISMITFMFIVRHGGLGVGSSLALLLVMVGNVLIGFLFFKEAIAPEQWVGIALGFVAVVLLLNIFKFF